MALAQASSLAIRTLMRELHAKDVTSFTNFMRTELAHAYHEIPKVCA